VFIEHLPDALVHLTYVSSSQHALCRS